MVADQARMIATNQLAMLRKLLKTLNAGNPFYQSKIQQAGLQNGVGDLDHFRNSMPLTTKAELVADQREYPPFGSNLSFALENYTRFHQTSGSTGTPMRWLDTPDSWQSLIANWRQVFNAAGVDANDRCFFAFSFGPFLGFWTAFEAAASLGCLCIPGGGMSTSARLKTIIDNGVTLLCCTPTYAIHLGQIAQKEGLDLAKTKLRKVLVAGEPGGSIPTIRALIESLLPNVRVFDHHGMTEIGPASLPCPEQPNLLHLIEPGFLAEVIDAKTLKPVAPGTPGELVLSNLERDGMPLLRYRTGDLVKTRTGGCKCGRWQTQLVGGILDRLDDMVIIRGVNLYPSAIDVVVRQFPAIAEYRVFIEEAKGLNSLRIDIETQDDSQTAVTASKLSDQLQATFNLRIQVAHVAKASLPRYQLKAKRWQRVSRDETDSS